MNADDLKVPDLKVVRKVRVIIRNETLINLSDVPYESLKEELKQLNSAIADVDEKINNALSTVPALLETDELQGYIDGLSAMTDSTPQSARDSYDREIKSFLDGFLNRFSQCRDDVVGGVFNAKTTTISGNSYMLSVLKSERETLLKQLSPEEKPLIKMKEQKAVLDQAIKAYTDTTGLDKAVALVDQAENVIEKNEKPGEMKAAAIKAGAEVSKTVLKSIDEAIKFEHMVQARTSLQDSIDRRERRMTSLEQQLDVNQKKAQQFIESQNITVPRNVYVYEATKVADTLTNFIDLVFVKPKDVLGTAALLLANAGDLKSYCRNLQPYWLRDV